MEQMLITFAFFTLILGTLSCSDKDGNKVPIGLNIDLEEVDSITIKSHIARFNLEKADQKWLLNYQKKKFSAKKNTVENLISLLNTIKFTNMVNDKPDKYKDFLVDSSGTQITVYSSNTIDLDIIIGLFGMESKEVYHTYVRAKGEKEVYAAPQFIGIAIERNPANYRNRILTKINKDSIQAISFDYHNDSSFEINNSQNGWELNGRKLDSLSIEEFVSAATSIIGTQLFDENINDKTPKMILRFHLLGYREITVSAFQQKNNTWVFSSSENKDNYFSDEKILWFYKMQTEF